MEQYSWAGAYIALGLVAAGYHWWKKKYIDRTTNCDLHEYLVGNPAATYRAFSAIVAGEIALSLAHTGGMLTLSELVAAFGVGYTCDSTFNKANDQETK